MKNLLVNVLFMCYCSLIFRVIVDIHNCIVYVLLMPTTFSPLRYPGGKSAITPFLKDVIALNCAGGGVYAEPYAGGAGAALALLFEGVVDKILINDFDPIIFAFWQAILTDADRFIDAIELIQVNIDQWHCQKEILSNYKKYDNFEVGFAAFYLNRCNRSGILKAGPIGGMHQCGDYKLNARFNKLSLISKIRYIHQFVDKISIFNMDAIQFLQDVVSHIEDKKFIYLDPPYFAKGQQLYMNSYNREDHANLAWFLETRMNNCLWILTYDDAEEISQLYTNSQMSKYTLNYCAHHAKKGSELIIAPPHLQIPVTMQVKYGVFSRLQVANL